MKKKLLCILLTFALLLPVMPVQADDTCEHNWSNWSTDYEATCGDTGEESRYCYNCYETQTRDIPATGNHDWDDWYVVKSATIYKTGLKERECWYCYTTQTATIQKLKPFVKFTKKTVKIKAGKTYKLKLKYSKGDSAKKWKSSNKKVVTVYKSGKIKAKKKGTAKITVTMKSGKKATCTIKVSAKKKSSSAKKSNKGGTVYWVPNGSVYHCTKNCPTLSRSRTIYSGSKSKCPKKRACKVCY